MHGTIRGSAPRHILDWLLWPILRLTWERYSRKNSHWWHWRNYRRCVDDAMTLHVHGDKTATSNVFLGTNFRWHKVVVLSPVSTQIHYDYHIGFIDGSTCQLCSVIINGQVALLRGPHDVHFFAITKYGKPLELIQVQLTRKWWLDRDVPLL